MRWEDVCKTLRGCRSLPLLRQRMGAGQRQAELGGGAIAGGPEEVGGLKRRKFDHGLEGMWLGRQPEIAQAG